MKAQFKYLVPLVMTMPLISFAQQAEGFKFKWNVLGEQKTAYVLTLENAGLQNRNKEMMYYPSASVKEIKYALPKGAIFCRMEETLHERFNFWFKVRMGCDDKYSN